MLELRMMLVSALVVATTLAGRRWGPSVAGALAGLPLIAGPVFYSLATTSGHTFAAEAASTALGGLVAPTFFNLTYAAAASRRRSWPCSLGLALAAWCSTGALVLRLPASTSLRALTTFLVLLVVPLLFPRCVTSEPGGDQGSDQLLARATGSAVLVLAIGIGSRSANPSYSGLLAVFPTMASTTGVEIHRRNGGAAAGEMLKAMTEGFLAPAIFCLLIAVLLPRCSVAATFALATSASMIVAHSVTWAGAGASAH